ncbi:MAG: YkgJ family cysteine cluster protein [Candidatus Kapaibacterium sp.]
MMSMHSMNGTEFRCRSGCGACCIAPSITTPYHGMPEGKRAGERCVHLASDERCLLFGRPERPDFCTTLPPSESMCGGSRDEALVILGTWEEFTRPD